MAITTAGDLVRKALGKILVLGTQDTLAQSDLDDGLDALNAMMDSWWVGENLAVFAIQQETFTTTAGVASYTIGPGATWDTTRPVRVLPSVASYQNVDYPIQPIDRLQYDPIPYKQTQGIPKVLFYDREYPTGTIYLYPAPYPSGITIRLDTYQQIQSFATAATLINLPPGYIRAIINNLAIDLAPDYNKDIPASLAKVAAESKANIKRNNRQDTLAKFDGALLYGSLAYNVYSDTYR